MTDNRLYAAMVLLLMVASPVPVAQAAHWWEAGPALPQRTGRVVDAADLLPPSQEATLTARLARLEQRTGHRFVVVTLRSLNGQAIETVGVRLGRTWGVGRKGANDGVLLIVAPTEHKVRIEVGYGLEKRLNDPICAGIIRNVILPRFRAGDMAGGINDGAARIADIIGT